MSEPADPPVGSVAEEVLKLLGALQSRAGAGGQQYDDVSEHLATGAVECRVCPICRAIASVRAISPEVQQHLASAGTSLLQAIATAMETPAPRSDQEDS